MCVSRTRPWAKAPYFVTAKELELQLALLPLLRRDFELVRLNIVEPVVALETSKDGKGNWELEPVAGSRRAVRHRSMRARAHSPWETCW
jgi:uncharacterized protein involved in outer membrane biogenesis